MRLIDADELKKEFNRKCVGECAVCCQSGDFVTNCTLIDNAPTIEPDTTGYSYGLIDEYNNIMDILRRSNVTVCLEDKRLLTICEYVEMKERGEL